MSTELENTDIPLITPAIFLNCANIYIFRCKYVNMKTLVQKVHLCIPYKTALTSIKNMFK